MSSSKYFSALVVALIGAAVVFTFIYMLKPDWLGLSAAESAAPAYETALFDKNSVMSVDISVDPERWQELLDNATDEEYINCDITINGVTYASVGIRAKGNTSLTQVANSDSDRYSFKVEFDQFVSGQTCQGLDKLALNNVMADATYMKEYLSYDLLDYMGVTTPLYAYANITLNGEPWGLYLAVECEEEAFAERVWGDDYGKLYKVETMNMGGGGGGARPDMGEMPEGMQPPTDQTDPAAEPGAAADGQAATAAQTGSTPVAEGQTDNAAPADGAGQQGRPEQLPEGKGGFGDLMGSGGADLVYSDDQASSYGDIFDNAVFKVSDADRQRVIKSIKNLNEGTDLEEAVNVDQVLRYFAVNTALVNLDSYAGSMKHNYYLYEADGQITIVPWDYNLSFGGFQGGSDEAANLPIDTPVSGVSLEERPLIGQLLAVDEYRERYHQYLQQILDEYYDSESFAAKVDSLNALIGDYVAADATAFYTYEEYVNSLPALETFVQLRSQSISGQLNGTIPATTDGQTAEPDQLVDASALDMSLMGSMGGGGGFGGQGPEGFPAQAQAAGAEAQSAPATQSEQAADTADTADTAQTTETTDLAKSPPQAAATGDLAAGMFGQSQMIDSSNWQLILVSVIALAAVLLIVWRWRR